MTLFLTISWRCGNLTIIVTPYPLISPIFASLKKFLAKTTAKPELAHYSRGPMILTLDFSSMRRSLFIICRILERLSSNWNRVFHLSITTVILAGALNAFQSLKIFFLIIMNGKLAVHKFCYLKS